jgi:putative transposase
MPRRNVVFSNGIYYHAFNRAVRGEEMFSGKRSLSRAIDLVNYYRYPQTIKFSRLKTFPLVIKKEYLQALEKKTPYVEIYAFSLMPDHYHFLLKQLSDNGVGRFISNFQNSYARYYNVREGRFGSLFQNPFKAKYVNSDEQLMHLSRYIHLNPVTSYLIEIEDLEKYSWTSYRNYVKGYKNFVNTDFILKLFGSVEKYVKFVTNRVDYQRELKKIKKLTLE